MKIDKNLIKELVNYLNEFNLTELEYMDGSKKIKVSKSNKNVISQNISEPKSGIKPTAQSASRPARI